MTWKQGVGGANPPESLNSLTLGEPGAELRVAAKAGTMAWAAGRLPLSCAGAEPRLTTGAVPLEQHGDGVPWLPSWEPEAMGASAPVTKFTLSAAWAVVRAAASAATAWLAARTAAWAAAAGRRGEGKSSRWS